MRMRWFVIGVAAAAILGCGSSWDHAVDKANDEKKPLVVEFYATWCKPCAKFEREVLPDAEVRRELEGISFYRYDYDSKAGQHHARRLGVRGVPTFIAVGRDGKPIGALRGAPTAKRFVAFLRWTRAKVYAR